MRLIGMMAVRNEDWVLGLSLRAALKWCDGVVVLLHECTDRSMEICQEIEEEIGPPYDRIAYRIESGEWDEMRHRQTMLECSRVWGATHMAIIDADEVITGNILPSRGDPELYQFGRGIRGLVGNTPAGHILQLPLYNLRHGIGQYHHNGLWGNRWVSVAFADSPELHWSGDQFHHREPMGMRLEPYRPIAQGQGGIMHLWGSNERRLAAKHRAYKITEALRWPNRPQSDIERQYNQYVADPGAQYSRVPDEWLKPYGPVLPIELDATPWQTAWCDAMIEKHGRARFSGLSV